MMGVRPFFMVFEFFSKKLARKGSTLFPKKAMPNIFKQDCHRGFYIVCITSWRYSPSHMTNRGNSLHTSSSASVEFLLPMFSLSDHVKISQFPCRIKENFYHLMTSH